MKKTLLIIFALGISLLIHSQSFQTSASNPNWSQAYWIGPGHTPFFYWYEMNSDTTIGAFTYGKVEYNTVGSSNYHGALRENSLEQILYIPKDSTNEMLIYDFSLGLNDTLYDIWCNRFGTWVKDTLKVVYLDSVQLGGNFYTHFTLENLNESGQVEWFESFGSKGDLIMHMPYLSVSGANYLTCFHNN